MLWSSDTSDGLGMEFWCTMNGDIFFTGTPGASIRSPVKESRERTIFKEETEKKKKNTI